VKTLGLILKQDTQQNEIKNIKGLVFTNREIEVIACLIHGRRIKKIALILSISPKTVESHIRNVMLKIECHSNEKIIDFVESSDNYSIIRDYYSFILERNYFEVVLAKIKKACALDGRVIQIIYQQDDRKKLDPLVVDVQKYFNVVDVKTLMGTFESQVSDTATDIMYIITHQSQKEQLTAHLKEADARKNKVMVFLNASFDIVLKHNNVNTISADEDTFFYLFMLDLMGFMTSTKEFCKIKQSCITQLYSLYSPTRLSGDKGIDGEEETNGLEVIVTKNEHISAGFYAIFRKPFVFLFPLVLIICLSTIFYYKNIQKNTKIRTR